MVVLVVLGSLIFTAEQVRFLLSCIFHASFMHQLAVADSDNSDSDRI